MANPEHIKWLLEGVEAWNKRRKNDFFLPDFGGYLPREVDLNGVNLSGADLSNISLIEVALSDSDISFANMTNAYVAGTNLTNANLSHTDLTGANLTNTDLTNVDLFVANLASANLASANLTGADLTDADLTDANLLLANLADATFIGAQPWKAILFFPRSSKNMENPKHIQDGTTIESVGDLLGKIKDTKKETTTLYFRGECECIWKLRPSVKRKDKFSKSEGEMLSQLITRRPQEFKGMSSA